MLSSLKTILRELETSCKVLVALLQKERACLVDFDARAVEELTKEKDTLLLRMRLLDEERRRLVSALSVEWQGSIEGELTLRVLAEKTGDAELSEIRLKLVSLAQSINDLSHFNKYLIDRSLINIRSVRGFFDAYGEWSPAASENGTLLSRET